MKTELLTFQTTVRVTYEPANPTARKQAIAEARLLMNDLGVESYLSDKQNCSITVKPTRSVYCPN